MRRLLDAVLVVAILGAVGFGAYRLGSAVDNTSKKAAAQDSELTQTTTAARSGSTSTTHKPVFLVFAGIGAAAGALILVSFASSAIRARRRARWHAT